jgi:hypothetical protein
MEARKATELVWILSREKCLVPAKNKTTTPQLPRQ